MTSVPVMSEGIRSGVNWMRLKREVEGLGEAGDEEGLGEAGDADEQGVAAGEDGDEDLLDDLVLADDDLGQFLADALGGGFDVIDSGGFGHFSCGGVGSHSVRFCNRIKMVWRSFS